MGWKPTTRELTTPKESPKLVADCLVSVRLILHFKLQFSRSIKSSTFNLSFEKKIFLSKNAQKSPKNLHKTAQQWLTK